jgi:hypothetical protein
MDFIKREAKSRDVCALALSSLYDKVSYYTMQHGFEVVSETHDDRVAKVRRSIEKLWVDYRESVDRVRASLDRFERIAGSAVQKINGYDYLLRKKIGELASLGCSHAAHRGDPGPTLNPAWTKTQINKAWFEFACDGICMTFDLSCQGNCKRVKK